MQAERVFDERTAADGEAEFLVKWLGRSVDDCTWERRSCAPDIVDEWLRAARRRVPTCNAFQEDLVALRGRVAERYVGSEIRMDKDAGFNAPRQSNCEWRCDQTCVGTIVYAFPPWHRSPFVCAALFRGERIPTPLTASSLLLSDTWVEHLHGREHPRDDAQPVPEGCKHLRSVERARTVMRLLIQQVGDLEDLEDLIVGGLDGNGENRRGYELELEAHGVPVAKRPKVITFEADATVALNQADRFGADRVRYTQSDWRQRRRQNILEGIEMAILNETKILTSDEKRRLSSLYLDFCGSPNLKVDYQDVYRRLPNLRVLAITCAKRQPNRKFNCEQRLRHAEPEDMELAQSFTQGGVVCKVFVKSAAKAGAAKKSAAKAIAKARDRVMASALRGTVVHIPRSEWRVVGEQWAQTLQFENKLCFRVSGTYHKYRCTIRAIKKDGGEYERNECFTLTPCQVRLWQA